MIGKTQTPVGIQCTLPSEVPSRSRRLRACNQVCNQMNAIRHFLPRAVAGLSLSFCLQRAEPRAPRFSFPGGCGGTVTLSFYGRQSGRGCWLEFSLTELGTRKGLISRQPCPARIHPGRERVCGQMPTLCFNSRKSLTDSCQITRGHRESS